MMGASYLGAAQWLAAAQSPFALKAIAPQTTSSSYYEGWCYKGGAFQLGFLLTWSLVNLALPEAMRTHSGDAKDGLIPEIQAAVDQLPSLFARLPLRDMPLLEELVPSYREWLDHLVDDDYWRATAPREHYSDVLVPSFNVGGWYDCFLGGTLENFQGMRKEGGSESARQPHLVVGPWAHGLMTGEFAEISFGARSSAISADVLGMQLRYFDRCRHLERGPSTDPPVLLFVLGENEWRTAEDWPVPNTIFEQWYLHSGGDARTADGDGTLSHEPPSYCEHEDTIICDSLNPVPTVGGATFLPGLLIAANGGPRDQRSVEYRQDVLCYSSSRLELDLIVAGPIQLVVYASSSAKDTDICAKLIDVHPDGRAILLTDGILRTRFRESFRNPLPLRPGNIYRFDLDLAATANVFKAGHRIRLEISGSNFPRFDRNPNTGGDATRATSDEFAMAVNRIFHEQAYPSALILPIVTTNDLQLT
jgi:hypothetical protein